MPVADGTPGEAVHVFVGVRGILVCCGRGGLGVLLLLALKEPADRTPVGAAKLLVPSPHGTLFDSSRGHFEFLT